MGDRIFDKNSKCDNTKITLGNTIYTLRKVPTFPDVFTFQVDEPDKTPDAVTFTRDELRALFFLLTYNKCE